MATPHAHLFSSESFGPLIHFELVLYIMWSRIQLYSFECEYLVVSALFIEKTPLSPLSGPGTLVENHLTLGTWLNNKQQKYGSTPGLWAQLHHLCLYVDCCVAVIPTAYRFRKLPNQELCVCVCVSSDFTFFSFARLIWLFWFLVVSCEF